MDMGMGMGIGMGMGRWELGRVRPPASTPAPWIGATLPSSLMPNMCITASPKGGGMLKEPSAEGPERGGGAGAAGLAAGDVPPTL